MCLLNLSENVGLKIEPILPNAAISVKETVPTGLFNILLCSIYVISCT